MLRWDEEARERAIDLACVPTLTVDDVAERMGCSRKYMFNFYRDNRAKIEAVRASVEVSDRTLVRLLDLWGDGLSQADMAMVTGLPLSTVRRLILIAEIDEEPEDHGAADSLAALQAAHPDKFYEEDVRALTEYSGWKRPTFLLAADCVAPFSQEVPQRVVQMPERGVSLAQAA